MMCSLGFTFSNLGVGEFGSGGLSATYFSADTGHTSLAVSCGSGQQSAHSHEVVDRQGEGKHPLDSSHSAVTRLAQTGDGLEPTEDLFDPFALLLTDGVAGMAGGTGIDNAGRLTCDVGSDLMVAQFLDEFFAVMALVGTQGNPPPACNLFHQLKCGLGFGAPGR